MLEVNLIWLDAFLTCTVCGLWLRCNHWLRSRYLDQNRWFRFIIIIIIILLLSSSSPSSSSSSSSLLLLYYVFSIYEMGWKYRSHKNGFFKPGRRTKNLDTNNFKSRHLLSQHQNNVWNLFKDTIKKPMTSFWCLCG